MFTNNLIVLFKMLKDYNVEIVEIINKSSET